MGMPPGIGPHNGKELELMLSGAKPFARFVQDRNMEPEWAGDADFEPYVERGEILRFVYVDPTTGSETRSYCLPTEEWRAKLSQLISQMCADRSAFEIFTTDDLHRLDGTLLGYAKQDIETFVARAAKITGRVRKPAKDR